MIGQWGHFAMQKDRNEYAISRYFDESLRLLGVLEQHLAVNDYLIKEYSIADMACFPWVKGGLAFMEKLSDKPLPALHNLQRWMKTIESRPATTIALEKAQSITL